MPCCAAPMMVPPNILMNTTKMPAMASPRTNFLAPSMAPDNGLRLGDDAGVQVRVDGHLPAGHGVQCEACADFRDAARALGDHDEVDDHQHHENHHADGVIAADHELAERGDDVARGV